ncbi:hypothetical protein DSO57_1022628 [Entomophthora muscae]|uniref:Uncharacterized protein n=1 Tax=Entomophthora muscae TaxID=34485 RepID=A0ACC2RU45_9FUNG|nr:hypothetical protein DSO57_1022628 [Entomophthora muscae]
MKTSDIKRDHWFRQEEEFIDVNNLPIIPDSKCAKLPIASLNQPIEAEQTTIIDVASNLITRYQLAHEPTSVEYLLFHCHPNAQRLLASFWSFLNSKAGSLEQLPNVKRVSDCIQNFVHPAIHHLLGVQTCHHMEVQDLLAYSNHQHEYQAALVHRLDLSFAEVQNYAHQNQVHHAQTLQCLNTLIEQLNTQLPNIVGKILDLRGALQTWCQDVTLHILAVEYYVEDAAWQEATHQEEIGHCTSKLADAYSKMKTLIKEFNEFSHIKQSELNRLKYLAHTAEAKIIKLKDNFVK